MGKSTVSTGPFSIVMLVYRRVTHKKSLVISYFIPIIFEKQFHKPSPAITMFIGGMFTIPSHGWFIYDIVFPRLQNSINLHFGWLHHHVPTGWGPQL